VRKAIKVAKMNDPKDAFHKQEVEIARLNEDLKAAEKKRAEEVAAAEQKRKDEVAAASKDLKERWKPAEMLTFWVPILESDRNRKDLAAAALKDVERVKDDPDAKAGEQGRALLVQGWCGATRARPDEARTALGKAKLALVGDPDALAQADAALKELSDPAGYAAARADILEREGKRDEALAALTEALEQAPAKDRGRLLARRSLLRLEAATTRGPLGRNDPAAVAARRDAEEAAKDGLAEGHYAAGRVAEETGRWDAAVASYTEAMKAHPALDAEGSPTASPGRGPWCGCRTGRGPAQAGRAAETGPRPEERTGRASPAPAGRTRARVDRPDLRRLGLLALLTSVALQDPDLPEPTAAQREAEKLADEVLRAPAGTGALRRAGPGAGDQGVVHPGPEHLRGWPGGHPGPHPRALHPRPAAHRPQPPGLAAARAPDPA